MEKSNKSKYSDPNSNYVISTDNEDIILTPVQGFTSTLIWLPGLRDCAESYVEDILDSKRFIPDKMKIIILTAPLCNKEDPTSWSWYRTVDRSKYQVDSYQDNVKRILSVIDNEAGLLKDYSKVFLGGFSQGALMSFMVGLSISKDKQLGGLVCCSGYLAESTVIREDEEIKKLPILICQGEKDERITKEIARGSQKKLFEERFNVTYKWYDFGHVLTWEEYKDIREFLEETLNKSQLSK
mmetsp:Transcript_18218/g.18845  ORF Transcript_18218/g.18845 Transcript_18218/m.18845 type:complete len:240 (-) Transcript_18218:34-753(-)